MVRQKLVKVGKTDQQRAMEAVLKLKPKYLYCMIDGAYPIRGRSSRVAFITLMAVIDGKPLILWTVIVKKKKVKPNGEEEETESEGESESESEGESEDNSIWTEVGSNALEGECHIL